MLRIAAPAIARVFARAGLSLLCASAILLGACRKEEPATDQPSRRAAEAAQGDTVVFRAGPRDRLCLKGGQVAFITYASSGNANCTVRGSVANGRIQPEGDTTCTVPLTNAGDRVTLGAAAPACAYYCGPGASFAGRTFDRLAKPEPVTDVAGDPLC